MTSSSTAGNAAELEATHTSSCSKGNECPDSIARVMFIVTVVVCAGFIAGIIAHLF